MKKQHLIVYIHGFTGSGFSNKALILRQHFRDVLSLSLPPQPNLAINNLVQTLDYIDRTKYEPILVGSSLGGFYSLYLANLYELRTILINPSIQPYITAQKYLGINQHFYDQTKFEWKQEHTDSLKQYEVNEVKNQENILLMITTGDEVLDYKVALKKLPQAKVDIEQGGDHEYKILEKKISIIQGFINQ